MEEHICLEDIKSFSKQYNDNLENKMIEKAMTKEGIEKICINKEIIARNQPVFNIELPNSKRENQENSHKCWIYAGLNTIKYNVAKNMNIDIMDLELSNNYIAFFDKLEKSNHIYENIIDLENADLFFIREEKITKFCVTEGGFWQYFVAIVRKYGMVPKSIMPDVMESRDYEKIETIYREKVKKDIFYLLQLKQERKTLEELRKVKATFLQENYNLLSKILGEPKFNFDYEYQDKNNQILSYKNLTPISFRDKFLNLDLNNFVSIGNVPMYNKEYGKMYVKKYLGNVFQKSEVTFLNLPIEDLKELVIKQLKDEQPVWFGIYHKKFRDKQSGVLDTRLYRYQEMFDFKPLTKKEALDLGDIWLDHAMCFCGVHIVDGKSIRWKVEDSKGDKEKVNGYYVMNDNYFDEFVLNIIIDKKYLSVNQLKLLEQEPLYLDVEDSL